MLLHHTPRSPAPFLACRGVRLRLHVRPNAFGNALGNSIVGQISQASQQADKVRAAATAKERAEIMALFEGGPNVTPVATSYPVISNPVESRDLPPSVNSSDDPLGDLIAANPQWAAIKGARYITVGQNPKGLLADLGDNGYTTQSQKMTVAGWLKASGQWTPGKSVSGEVMIDLDVLEAARADLERMGRNGVSAEGMQRLEAARAQLKAQQGANNRTMLNAVEQASGGRSLVQAGVGSSAPVSITGEIRGIEPGFWERTYGSPEVQKVLNNTITGQFVVKPLLNLFGQGSAVVRDDRYDFSQLRELSPVETQRAKENLIVTAGTMFIPGGAAVSATARTEQVAVSQAAIRERVLANIAETRAGNRSSNIELFFARSDQIASGYAADVWTNTTLQQGSVVYAMRPGASAYFTDLTTLQNSQLNAQSLSQSLQVKPHEIFGYRPDVTGFRVTQDLVVPGGQARANSSIGVGGGNQFFIQDSSKYLEPISTIHLNR